MQKSFLILLFLFFSVQSSSIYSQKKSTKAPNVSVLEKSFVIEGLNTIPHKIWVYLPPNYHKTKRSFPVIYMHDAQNLFDTATSYVGEWSVDELLNDHFKKTKQAFIVVGVENGGEKRIEEYTPWKNEKYGGGKGSIYIDFIKNTLKPYIDNKYRTKKEKEYTGIIGSSLGGLISFYGGLKYPNTFGKIGALSTSFWFSDSVFDFAAEKKHVKNSKLYLLVGEQEGENMVSDTKKMSKQLLSQGFPAKNLKTKIVPNGKHNETFWKQEFLEVITFLYPNYESTNH